MERTDSMARLLENDELDLNRGTEELSSGYESESETSSTEAECDVITDKDTLKKPEKVLRYRSTSSLCDHLKFILSMPELCDVIFLVGENRKPVHGVKAILAARSEVFYNIIMECQKKIEQRDATDGISSPCYRKRKMKIEVHKYKPEDFRHLIQFVHCGKVKIGDSNLPGLLCGAYQFGLPDLKAACWDYVAHRQREGAVSKLRQSAETYKDHKAGRKLISKLTPEPEIKVTCT